MDKIEASIIKLDPISIILLITLLVLLFIAVIFLYQMYIMIQRAKFSGSHTRRGNRRPVTSVSAEVARKDDIPMTTFRDRVNTYPPRVPLNQFSRVPRDEVIKVQIELPPWIEIEEVPNIQTEEPISSGITEHGSELSSNEQNPPSADRNEEYCV